MCMIQEKTGIFNEIFNQWFEITLPKDIEMNINISAFEIYRSVQLHISTIYNLQILNAKLMLKDTKLVKGKVRYNYRKQIIWSKRKINNSARNY